VAGNIRRSSELILGNAGDIVFLNLKNYKINPERQSIGWMSNNTVRLTRTEDFSLLPMIAERVRHNGEPGILNLINIQRYGRIGKYHNTNDEWTRELEKDHATLANPCITSDTYILTNQGWRQVKDLIGKSFIAIIDGKEYSSTSKGFWHTGKKEIFRLVLDNGLTLKATADHKIYTLQGKKTVSELTSDDYIITPDITRVSECQHLKEMTRVHENPLTGTCWRVAYIDPSGIEDVYDCTINEIHCFNANGMRISNCSEIPLEPFELCNLSEVFPTRCMKDDTHIDETVFLQALRYATFYSSTISLLPTHWSITNEVIARNRRIGVSLSGIADLYDAIGFTELTRLCRLGYKTVREENSKLAREAGVPPSIRVTTTKPSGTISQLVGVSSGMHFPTFKHAIRRMRVADDAKITQVLKDAGYPHENDVYSDRTIVFEFPIDQGKTRSAEEVSMWEQFSLLAMLQREYSDNMVSCTIYFNPETEGSQVEYALAQFAPVIKSCSMLPHTKEGVYKQSPYEKITREQYEELKKKILVIDWSKYCNSDGVMPKYCTNDSCEP
jgi:hypothetical protein